MCRWIAYISPSEDCLLEDVLVTPAHALSKQVNDHHLPLLLSHDPSVHTEHTTEAEITVRNRLLNIDGFGMAWYTPTQSIFSSMANPKAKNSSTAPPLHPILYKTIQPPLHDSNFRSICASTASTCVLAHIRAATSTAVTATNNHPFVFGRHTIMHNGYISSFPIVARQIHNLTSEEAFANIKGTTDTETFAALYMSFLTAGAGSSNLVGAQKFEQIYTPAEMLEALRHAASTVIELQITALGKEAEPNDLNVCVTDGTQLVAMRFRNHKTEQPPSLYYSKSAGVTLNRRYPDHPDGAECPEGEAEEEIESSQGVPAAGRNHWACKKSREHGRHVIVASEPTTYKDVEWTLILKNHAVLVDDKGVMTIEKVGYEG